MSAHEAARMMGMEDVPLDREDLLYKIVQLYEHVQALLTSQG